MGEKRWVAVFAVATIVFAGCGTSAATAPPTTSASTTTPTSTVPGWVAPCDATAKFDRDWTLTLDGADINTRQMVSDTMAAVNEADSYGAPLAGPANKMYAAINTGGDQNEEIAAVSAYLRQLTLNCEGLGWTAPAG